MIVAPLLEISHLPGVSVATNIATNTGVSSIGTLPDSGVADVLSLINVLYRLPSHTLVAIGCIVFGYCLRLIKQFPNDGIPLACILFGMVVNPLVQDPPILPGSLRVWIVKNILVGAIVGAFAWMIHRAGLKRIETRFPVLGGLLVEADKVDDN